MRPNITFSEAKLYRSVPSELFLSDDELVNGPVTNCPDEKICRIDALKFLRERR